ncbi:hypothetical protein ACLBOM_04720 [Escherichia coli]
MEGLLQQRHREGRLSGVLNGVDEKIWSPETTYCWPRVTPAIRWKIKRK